MAKNVIFGNGHQYWQSATKSIATPPYIEDHRYSNFSTNLLMIDQQYADDISWITNKEERKNEIRKQVPPILKEKNLQVNDSKTEEYEIKRGGDENWKKCKYLGTLLDTESDINRRKILALAAFKQLSHIFNNKKVSEEVKLRLLRSHVESIFLYNCEIWTITKALEDIIDTFQRVLYRKIFNITWTDKVSNTELYEKAKSRKWSTQIKKRRLQWYGHLLRLPDESSAKAALGEARRWANKSRGGQKKTWLKMIDKDLENISIKVQMKDSVTIIRNHYHLAQNRTIWASLVNCAMSADV